MEPSALRRAFEKHQEKIDVIHCSMTWTNCPLTKLAICLWHPPLSVLILDRVMDFLAAKGIPSAQTCSFMEVWDFIGSRPYTISGIDKKIAFEIALRAADDAVDHNSPAFFSDLHGVQKYKYVEELRWKNELPF